MKHAGIITNIKKDDGLAFTEELANWLINKGCTVYLPDSISGLTKLIKHVTDTEELYSKSDFILALGGDGTMLRVSHKSALYDKPVLGINLGTLGYLTSTERSGAYEALDKLLTGDYTVEKRMMLSVTPFFTSGAADLPSNEFLLTAKKNALIGLNDVSVSRGVFSKMISLELRVNNEFIDIYRADGIIISTPTGSTAYNLSAGGPILKPDSEMIAITLICPHMIHFRPYVISADDTVHLKIAGASDDAILAIDGENTAEMKFGDEISISRSKYGVSIIKTNKLGFYDILRTKLVEKARNGSEIKTFV